MKFMYAILSVAGWVWLVVAFLLLWWRLSLLRRRGGVPRAMTATTPATTDGPGE